MHALGEIKATNRYIAQPVLAGGWNVIDRVNGFAKNEQPFATADEAMDEANRLNGK